MTPSTDEHLSEESLTVLRFLATQFPTLDATLAEVARLSAVLTLPKGPIHVISDIHGDDTKLRHVLNNASGMLRPLVEHLFADELGEDELTEFLALLFYPREMLERLQPELADQPSLRDYCRVNLRRLFKLIRELAARHPRQHVLKVFPDDYRTLLSEMLREGMTERGQHYYDELIDSLVRHQGAWRFMRLTVRVVRNLAYRELIIAGDCWDRGPRGDRVVEHLQRHPNVAFIWGNHDTAWLGACLGHEACIAHVIRISARYRRLSQLEEGYGVTLQPLEHLVRQVYADDPAETFKLKGTGLREEGLMRRMQKAAAIMQYKLEGQMMARNPEWGLDHRRLLHRMRPAEGTIEIDGVTRTLRDTNFPTIDPNNPYELSAEERACMDRLKVSFYRSEKLWEQIRFLLAHGSMYVIRDDHLIFHACVPVDENGEYQALSVRGVEHKGRALFDAIEEVLTDLLDEPSQKDLDLMWYLWCGPQSPLFGKDRICTFEIDLVEEPETQVETKNPYFQMIHEVPFCDKILQEFGCDPGRGLIVNGHVPVKIEKGENPIKRSNKAITIDGAFSIAYGDHGYTLVLESDRTLLAKHHHFESVEAAIEEGVDIIPAMTEVRNWGAPKLVADTEEGEEIRRRIAWLEKLVLAYRTNMIRA